jgi:phosphate-selective porin
MSLASNEGSSSFGSLNVARFFVLVALVAFMAPVHAGTVEVDGNQLPDLELESEGGLRTYSPDDERGFSFGGHLHVDAATYDGAFNKGRIDPETAEGESSSNFDLRRLRFNIKAHTGNWHFKLGYDLHDNDDRRYVSNSTATQTYAASVSTATDSISPIDLRQNLRAGFTDLYIQYRAHQWAWVTFGRHKMPFSMDYVTSSNDLMALERNIISNAFSIRRQDGISVRGHGGDSINFSYHFALFREDPVHLGEFYDSADKNNISAALRATSWIKFNEDSTLHFGLSWAERNLSQGLARQEAQYFDPEVGLSHDGRASCLGEAAGTPNAGCESGTDDDGLLPTPTTSTIALITSGAHDGTLASRLVFESEAYDASLLLGGPVAYDGVSSYALEFGLAIPHFHMKVEWAQATYDGVSDITVDTGSELDAYSAEFAWVITGELRPYNSATGTYGRVKPRSKRFGAWELFARFSEMDLDTDIDLPVTAVYADPKEIVNNRPRELLRLIADYGSDDYSAITVGFNWYASNNIRLTMNAIDASIEHTSAAGDVVTNKSNDSGVSYQFRVQYAF